jgi:lipopolysaccharide export system permease protein
MRKLDRYMVTELAGPFLFGVALFLLILVVGTFLSRLVEYVVEQGIPMGAVLCMFAYQLPRMVVLTFPMSMLLGTLLSVQRLGNDSEMQALFASGASLYRIAVPILLCSLLVGGVGIVVNEFVVPGANERSQDIKSRVIENREEAVTEIVAPDIRDGTVRRIVYAARLDVKAGRLDKVTVLEMAHDRVQAIGEAEYARWDPRRGWRLYNGEFRKHPPPKQGDLPIRFGEAGAPIDIGWSPRDLILREKNPEEMSIRQIRAYIGYLRAAGKPTAPFETQMHDKLALPLAAVVFALVGVPMGVRRERSRSAALGFGISILIIFGYWVVWYCATIAGQGGRLPPVVAAWLADALFGIIGIVLLIRAAR